MPSRYQRRYATYKRSKRAYRKQTNSFGGGQIRSPAPWRGQNMEIHKFVYCGNPLEMFSGSVTDNTIGNIYGNRCASPVVFQLNSLPTVPLNNITSNYSWYRIVKGDVWFQCTSNQNAILNSTEPAGGTNLPYQSPTVHYDFNNVYNGFTLSSGWNYQPELAQSSGYGNFDPLRTLPKFRVYPKAQALSVNPSPPTAISQQGRMLGTKGQWQSTANPGLQHLCMRLAIDPILMTPPTYPTPSMDQPFKLYVYTRYYIELMSCSAI